MQGELPQVDQELLILDPELMPPQVRDLTHQLLLHKGKVVLIGSSSICGVCK